MAEDARVESARPLLAAIPAWIGRLTGPIVAVAVYAALPDGLAGSARATAAVGVLMAIWWMTEAMPLPATSLVPIALFPLAGVLTIGEAAAPYASDVIFLFMGGFMLALAMQRWGLHRRIALRIVLLIGTQPTRLVGGFMVAAAFLSMWISNTATTVMMLPIGTSVVALVADHLREQSEPATPPAAARFATGLMLAIAYAASIGSLGTLIGTPPNLLLRGFLERAYGIEIGFGQWMAVGVPLATVFLALTWLLLTRVLYPPGIADIPGGRALIRDELAQLGPPSRGELGAAAVFVATATAWVLRDPLTSWEWLTARLPWIAQLSDAGIAIIAALALFAIPVDLKRDEFVLDWATAKELPWNVLLLFGGGLSLATAVQTSGLDAWIGEHVGFLAGLPTLALVVGTTTFVIFLTELTSNTATAATFLPILGGIATASALDPLLLLVPAALAASCAFMMPVATPPNAIVFGSGHVTIAQMVRAGIALNLLAILLITVVTSTVATWVFGIDVR